MDEAEATKEALLRTLERRYASFAARLFKAHGIPEPARLTKPTLSESQKGEAVGNDEGQEMAATPIGATIK
jgi:hypothetical protein